jgi:hypothetical protein
MDHQNGFVAIQCGGWRWESDKVSKRRCGSRARSCQSRRDILIYTRLNALLDAADFDRFVESQCAKFYAPVMRRSSLAPGRYFQLLLVGYFEGIDSERGIAWRASDSLALPDAGRSRFPLAPTHGGGALVAVTDHHHRLLLTGDHFHYGPLSPS